MFNSRNVVFHICRVLFVTLIIKSAMAKVITDITVHSHPSRAVAVRSQVWNMWPICQNGNLLVLPTIFVLMFMIHFSSFWHFLTVWSHAAAVSLRY